jgi:hypothetical protein
MSRARQNPAPLTTEATRPPVGSEVGVWQVADGVLFSVLSSMVLWSLIITSVYRALS